MTDNNFRIMKLSEFEDAMFYKASCGCGGHTMDLWLELDEDGDSIVLYMEGDLHIKINWGRTTIFSRAYRRVKYALQILLTGRCSMAEDFLFTDIEQIDSFLNVLEEGKQKMIKVREK